MKEAAFMAYVGWMCTFVRITNQGDDIPVIAHDGRSDRQHIAGFRLENLTQQEKAGIKSYLETLLETDPDRWVAVYRATEGTMLINRGLRVVVHGYKPVKSGDYEVMSVGEFIAAYLS